WLTLPRSSRWSAPRFEYISRDSAPIRTEPGVEARVYSGSSGAARAQTHNYVPVTLIDVRLQPGARFEQELPDSYNGFIYVLDGDVSVGDRNTSVAGGQVGWLAAADAGSSQNSSLSFVAGDEGARVLLYAGERQGVPIVQHGPFVGESRNDIVRLSQVYMSGKMPRISELTPSASVR
ncbi:MAG: pirin-like C-terminal cupin domain-containing protein, partial [Gemmatimonadaceae bacterium]